MLGSASRSGILNLQRGLPAAALSNKSSFTDLLCKICEKLSGNDDVWYATNGEIYEYVNAYKSLIYSADGTVVYNPTLLSVWFDVDKTLYRIEPGETLKLFV